MRRRQALATALVGLVLLSGQSGGALNNRCEDFTSAPQTQIHACSDLMDFPFSVTIWHALMMRAAAYFRAGDTENAKKDYGNAVQTILRGAGFYSTADSYASVCWTFAILNIDLDKTMGDCNMALKLDPKNGFAFNSRGFIDLRRGKYHEAIEDYDRALERPLSEDVAVGSLLYDRRRHYALFGRGLGKLRLGDTDAGMADIEAAEKLKPGVTIEFGLYGLRVAP